jgi:hypothetical protein
MVHSSWISGIFANLHSNLRFLPHKCTSLDNLTTNGHIHKHTLQQIAEISFKVTLAYTLKGRKLQHL